MTRTCEASALIRDAGPDDAAALAAFGSRTYRAHYASLWSAAALEAYLGRHYGTEAIATDLATPGAVRYLIALDGRDVVGFAKAKRDRAVPSVDTERGLELEKIYVAAGRTGSGVGSALLGRTYELAALLGEPCVWLQVLKSNDGARRLYERHGFVARAEIPFATDRGEIGMHVMTRAIPCA